MTLVVTINQSHYNCRGCCDTALHKESFKDAIDAALPPDVRRGSASPFKSRFQWGCALGPGLAPKFYEPKAEPWA
jgi:hypothetical protein